jgi:hypothetical protein
VAILNDDIFVKPIVFEFLALLDWAKISLVGLGSIIDSSPLTLSRFSYVRHVHLGRQAPGFGQAMFMAKSSYKVIPEYFNVWFGDDLQVLNSRSTYSLSLSSVLIHGRSSTIFQLRDEGNADINQVIKNDIRNAVNHEPMIYQELADWLLAANP